MKLIARRAAVFSLIACMIAAPNAGAVALTVYTDRADWEAAVGGAFLEENFDGFDGVSYEFSPVDVGDFTVSVDGTTFGYIWHNIGPVTNSNDVNGTAQINAATGDTGGTTLSFDSAIYAFGANWQGISDLRTTSFNIGGTILDIPNINGGFFGFVSDTLFFDSLLFLSDGAPDGFGIDNVVYAAVDVPEPGTLALLGIGLLGMGIARRRKIA